jgi:predicted AAA+ superfamily ATPase
MERKELIKRILIDWQSIIKDKELFDREITIPPITSRHIVTLTGPRRAGKTSILQLLARRWTHEHESTPALYINFEDERLDLTTEELSLIIESYRELYPDSDTKPLGLFFDEIQMVPNWERFLRRLHESGQTCVVVTGSNSKALSSDIATALRGRTLNSTVLPLSFREFYKIRTDRGPLPVSTKDKVRLARLLLEYLTYGGFPDVVLESDLNIKTQIHQEYYQVMLFRDLVERFKIQQVAALKFFLKRLLASSARPISVHKIWQELKSAGHNISKDTAYEFMDHAEDIFFMRRISQHSKRVVHRELGEKKVYPIDCGYLNSILGINDLTKNIEIAVFSHFLAQGFDVAYLTGDYECDFIVSDSRRHIAAFQVAYSIEDKQTEMREIRGLRYACEALELNSGTIVTAETSNRKIAGDIKISMTPFPNLAFTV